MTSFLSQYVNEIAFIFCSILGGMMHYLKKYLRKETDVSLFRWFGNKNWVATIYTLVMFIFVTIGALAGGIINSQTDFWAVLYTGFITGFAVDAGFNSDRSITGQLNEIKAEHNELFEVEDNRNRGGRVGRLPYERDAGPDVGDETPDEKPRRQRPTPVAGSPKVPPKKI